MKIYCRTLIILFLSITTLISAERVELWTPEQVIAELSGKDYTKQKLAEGQLYLLPSSTFPTFAAILDRRIDQYAEPWATRIALALILRGYPPAVTAFVNTQIANSPHSHAYSLKDHNLLSVSMPDELVAIANEFARRIEKSELKISYSGDELWIQLAGITCEKKSMQLVLELAASPQGRVALPRMAGRFEPDKCADYLMPVIMAGETPQRLNYLRLLRAHWQSGPSARVAALLKDPEPSIRETFARTLQGATSEAALKLIIQGLNDPESSVRSACLNALSSFKGEPQTELLRKLAINDRLDDNLRVQAWQSLTHVREDFLVPEAKTLVGSEKTEQSLRQAALYYLIAHKNSRWLLDAVPRLDTRMKANVLTALAHSGSEEVITELPAFMRRAEGPLAAQVIQSLSSIKDEKIIPLFIGYLKDPRSEVRQAASTALERVTGLSYRPMSKARGEQRNEADEVKQMHSAWSRWYDLFAAPLAPALAEEKTEILLELSKTDRVIGSPFSGVIVDPFAVLLRLVGDKKVGDKALNELVSLGDARTAATLVDLLDGPTFSHQSNAVTRALMRCRVDNNITPQLFKLLGNPETMSLAMRVLIAWRISSPTLTEAILNHGYLSADLLADLASWKECPVLNAARKMLSNDKTDERVRAQALQLLVQLGDDRDVKAFAQELSDGGSGMYQAARGLVRMSGAGVESASVQLARLLSVRKTPPKPVRPTTKKPAEAIPQKPDPIPIIIAALRERPRDDQQQKSQLSDSIIQAIQSWCQNSDDISQQMTGLFLLMEAGEPSGVSVLETLMKTGDASSIGQLIDLVVGVRTQDVRPYVDRLQRAPGLNESQMSRIISWYREVGKVENADILKVKLNMSDWIESNYGKPVGELLLNVKFADNEAALDAKDLKCEIEVKNVGKTPFSCFPEFLAIQVHIRQYGADFDIYHSLRIAFKSKPNPPPNQGTQLTVISPGRSFKFNAFYEAPGKSYVASGHQVRLTMRVERALGEADLRTEKGVFSTPWMDHSFLPPLWEAIDKRSLGK